MLQPFKYDIFQHQVNACNRNQGQILSWLEVAPTRARQNSTFENSWSSFQPRFGLTPYLTSLTRQMTPARER
jgi:hypothetical protein